MLGTGWSAMAQCESTGSTTRHAVTRYFVTTPLPFA